MQLHLSFVLTMKEFFHSGRIMIYFYCLYEYDEMKF